MASEALCAIPSVVNAVELYSKHSRLEGGTMTIEGIHPERSYFAPQR